MAVKGLGVTGDLNLGSWGLLRGEATEEALVTLASDRDYYAVKYQSFECMGILQVLQ